MNANLKQLINVFSADFVSRLKQHFQANLVSVVVFGSVARGKIKRGSDIDYLIVLKTVPKSYAKRCKIVLPILHKCMNTPVYEKIETIHPALFPTPLIFSLEEIKKHPSLMLDMTEFSEILFDDDSFFAKELGKVKKRLKELGSKKIKLPDGTAYWKIKPNLRLGEEINI